MKAQIPLRRDGRPEEISAAVVFLASDESSYITGVALPIDGGFVAAVVGIDRPGHVERRRAPRGGAG